MTLDVTPVALHAAITASRQKQMQTLSTRKRMIQAYCSPAFRGGEGVPDPENFRFQFVLHTLARGMQGSPKPRFSTRRIAASERVAELETWVDRWRADSGYDAERQRVILDMCFGSCFGIVEQKAKPGFESDEDPPMMPQARVLSRGMGGVDALATRFDEARLTWHVEIDDPDFLKRRAKAKPDEGWDIEAIEALENSGRLANELRGKEDVQLIRNEVVHYVIWVRDYVDEESVKGLSKGDRKRIHGTIFRIGMCGNGGHAQAKYLSKPKPYFGPASGPHFFGGFLPVPDEVETLSPLVANDGQVEMLNRQARGNDRLSEGSKDIPFVSGDQVTEDGKAALVAAKHGQLVVLPGEQVTTGVMKVGGPTAESLLREEQLRDRVERNLGLDDVRRGQVTGDATATENQLAANSTDRVAELEIQAFNAVEKQIYLKVAWWYDEDSRTMAVREDDLFLGGQGREEKTEALDRAVRVGVLSPEVAEAQKLMLGGEPGTIDDLEINLDQVREDGKMLQRITVANNIILQYTPLVMQGMSAVAPGLQKMFEHWADVLELPWMANFWNFEAATEIATQAAEAEAAPQPRTIPAPKPTAKPTQGNAPKPAKSGASQGGKK